ncbi:MAG: transposase [Lachnospiraceae bacterium]
MIPYKQLSVADIFQDCQDKFDNDKPAFLSLLENHINLDEIIPVTFYNHFYASTGRTRKYPLHAFLWALIIQRIFSIPTDQLLLTFLCYSKPLREFCGFSKVPDASKITRFKQDFLDDLQTVFDRLVDLTEPICQAIDSAKANMTIFDSSGIEAFVTENNPKYANRIIKQLKAYAKSLGFDKNYDPYKAAYGNMPSHAASNPAVNNPKVFLGDAAFDTVQLYKDLLTGDTFGRNRHFSKAYIPLNNRSSLADSESFINENGIPCCPKDLNLPLKREGNNTAFLANGIARQKFICPLTTWDKCEDGKYRRICHCEDPCTSSISGRMVYIYPEKDLRAYPGTLRGTEEWDTTYKVQTVVEQNINHIKGNLCLAGRHTQNEKTLHADLILAGITQLITVILADKIHQHKYIRSLKPLIA